MAAHPQSQGTVLAIPARHSCPQRHSRPPAPGPAGSLGAIRWQRPISSLFQEVFSDGKGEKGICEPCKPIPLSWVNNGSSVGTRMPGCQSREMGLKCSLSHVLSWGAAGGASNPLQSPSHFPLGVPKCRISWSDQGLQVGPAGRAMDSARVGGIPERVCWERRRTQAKEESGASLARARSGIILGMTPHSSTALSHASLLHVGTHG